MENIFIKNVDEYHRLNDPVLIYIEQAAIALSKKNGYSVEANKKVVKHVLSKSNIKNPEVTYIDTDNNGDKFEAKTSLRDYIDYIRTDEVVTTPSFTSYIHPAIKKSLHANFLDNNIALRSNDKKTAFKAKQQGDKDKFIHFNTLQKTRKTFNNSLSGAYASKSTTIYTPSAHYSLTSTTRVIASIGNSITESMVSGNKLLLSGDIAYNYILTILSNYNDDVKTTIVSFGLHIPTSEEVLNSILESTSRYWRDNVVENRIKELLDKCDEYELAYILYVNSLWYLIKFNKNIVWDMLKGLSNKTRVEIDDPIGYINGANKGILNMTRIVLYYRLRGTTLDYDELDITLVKDIASVVYNANKTLSKYSRLIKTFFVTNIMPPNIAYIKDMFRDSVVLSDTDSSVGAYDQVILEYYDDIDYSEEQIGIASATMLLTTEIMDHYIKMFSGHMNVSKEDILKSTLAMKSEFFYLFTDIIKNKTAVSQIGVIEMNCLKDPELELKGVHLIASKSSEDIHELRDYVIDTMRDKILAGDKISITKIAKLVADKERSILADINSGKIHPYELDKIKEASAYKLDPASSPYLHHMLWDTVFKDKYGPSNQPQYMVIKIPTILDRASRVNAYIDSINDIEIKNNLKDFLTKYNKTSLGTFRLPLTVIANSGIPEEILPAIDAKRVIETSLNSVYLILESLKLFRKDNLLFSDMGY